MICIVNYGAGNIKSVINAVKTIGYDPVVTKHYNDIENASVIILPGVGAFPNCMNKLKSEHMIEALNEQILIKKKPFLGICMGLQILANKGYEEIETEGLGWIPGEVVKIEQKKGLRIPHMGWNNVKINKKKGLFSDFQDNPTFYFVHSYYFRPDDDRHVTATCKHGKLITASIQKENIFAVQFHPEKSQDNGLRLLTNFFETVDY